MPAVRRHFDQSLELRHSSNSEQSLEYEDDTICSISAHDNFKTKNNRRPVKHVRFARVVHTKLIKKIDERFFEKLWYSLDELHTIRKECKFTVACMANANMSFFMNEEENQYCPRGLEHMTPEGRRIRNKSKQDSKKVVMYEQWRQWDHDEFDDYSIAAVYAMKTLDAARLAHSRALKDQHDNL